MIRYHIFKLWSLHLHSSRQVHSIFIPQHDSVLTKFTGPPDRPYVDLESILCRPFSRGTIVNASSLSFMQICSQTFFQHIESADPHDPPIIDPHLFEEEIDLDLLMAAFKMVRQLTRSPHLQSVIEKEVQPLSDIQMDELIKGIPFHLQCYGTFTDRRRLRTGEYKKYTK